MSKIKAAIIGTGFMGTAHLEALKRIGNVDVIAIASDDKKRAEEMAYQFDIDMVYGNWSNVVNDKQVQVIHNCTPNYLHYPINKAVIEKGKHIISEKPLTVNSSQSEELVGLAQKRGIVHAINFNYRFYPLIQQAKSLMDEGALGEIYLIHGHYLQDWLYYDTDYNWRLETEISGNSRAMADIGSHWCDLVQFITGLKIKRICA
ncbi:MAG: Gfo/Idh/MocA family oxidoreductase, partial [Aliifodinibius sp.]|nr:Gfo/Idh/MocA family oxidoreductase [Fodinibius sp.]NIW42542.1 Gfo/Idh/MocA family oxidoreductase [candidate division Zixibacteria bacterium]NIY30581.1 Gfo/Idh/MocA family oxidoreductase [Fodinibius sp.]